MYICLDIFKAFLPWDVLAKYFGMAILHRLLKILSCLRRFLHTMIAVE